MNKKHIVFLLVLTLVLSSFSMAFATEADEPSLDNTVVTTDMETTSPEAISKPEPSTVSKPAIMDKRQIKAEYQDQMREAKALKMEALSVMKGILKELETAEAAGDEALIQELKLEAEAARSAVKESQNLFKDTIQARKDALRGEYSDVERKTLSDAEKRILSEDPEAAVIGYDSIFSNKSKFKFDTPPVIKGGRTLVPVRALTEGFKATVTWDEATQTVTVSRDGTIIELKIGDNTATVNGKPVVMDTKAGITNSRTYVPMRFIMEAFKLSVEWDEETRTIEIDDPALDVEDEAAPAPEETTPESEGSISLE